MAMINISAGQAVLLGLVLLVVSMFTNSYIKYYRRKRLGGAAPYLPSWIPFGLSFPYHALQSALHHTVLELWLGCLEKSGCFKNNSYTFEFDVLLGHLVFTADLENVKALLATQFTDYGKGQHFHDEWHEFLGDSIFTTDGSMWHNSRQLIRPMFMRERVADLDVVEQHFVKLLRLMGSGDGSMIRLEQLLSRYTLDAATHFLFGHSAGSLDDPNSKFSFAFDEVQRMQALNIRAGPLRFLISQKSFKNSLKTMDEFIGPWIEETLSYTPEELDAKFSKSDTFIHALARHTRDRKVIRDQLYSLLLAGRDTTAATLSWIFLELSRNPRVVAKLHAEIESVVGTRGQLPTYENIKSMKYLTYVINETLRLYPAVPYNVRSSNKDTTLPRGSGPDGMGPVGVLANTPIGYSTLILQRRRDLYPPISEKFPYDPLEWVPERWETWTPASWHYTPFSGGPRICIGQQFALVETGYTVIRILQEFDQIIDHGNTTRLKTDILLTPLDGVKVGFVRQSQA